MRIKFKISKLANLFFFVSNLSEWNPYCRKEYNQLWLKNNPLNKKEKEALSNIEILLKKYDISKIFLSSSQPTKTWRIISFKLNQENFNILKKSLNVFLPRFNKIWRTENKNLILIKKNLSIKVVLKKILFLFKILFGGPIPNSINVFLITNPITERVISGGQGLGENKITVECSKLIQNNNLNNQAERVILHELIHASFEKKIKEKIKNYIKSNKFQRHHGKILTRTAVYKQTKSLLGVIKEIIAVSLLPEGYLAEKFYGFDVFQNLNKRRVIAQKKLKKTYYDLMLFAVAAMYKTAKKYSENKLTIDNYYIEKAIDVWESFEKSDLTKIKF